MTISSVRAFDTVVELKSQPKIGTWPMSGTALRELVFSSLISPAMRTDLPSSTTSVELTLDALIGGEPPSPPALSPGELTSTAISRVTIPEALIRGDTLRLTPVERYWIWVLVML